MPQPAKQAAVEQQPVEDGVKPPPGGMTCPRCLVAQVGLVASGACRQCGWTWPRAREVAG